MMLVLSSTIYDFLKARGVKANIGDHSVWGDQEMVKVDDREWEPVGQAHIRKAAEKVAQIKKRYLKNKNLPVTKADAHLLEEHGQLAPLLTRDRQFGKIDELFDLAINQGVENSIVAYYKLHFLDALPAKPPNTKDGREAYIDMTRLVTATFERITDRPDLSLIAYDLPKALNEESVFSALSMNDRKNFRHIFSNNAINGDYDNIDEYRWDGKLKKEYVRKFINDAAIYEHNKKSPKDDRFEISKIENDREYNAVIKSLNEYFSKNKQNKTKVNSKPKPIWNRVSSVGREKPHRIGPASKTKYNTNTLKDIFGFKSALPEKGVDYYDAQDHFRETGMAFADLSRILGIPEKQISLNGRLRLVIGRDYGRYYSAYAFYRHTHRAIHIDSSIGSGSLAHEWFHAVDNIVNEVWGGELGGFLTGGHAPKNKVSKAAKELVHSITRQGSYSKKTQKRPLTNLYAYAKYHDEKYRNKPYLSLVHEIAARCFESYVHDKLYEKGYKNEYLVKRDLSLRELKQEADDISDGFYHIKSGARYPMGSERKKINKAFDNFFDILRETNTFEKSIAYLEFLEARRLAA